MPYSQINVTPLIEQSDFRDLDNSVFKVNLSFKLWDRSRIEGNVTYISSKKLDGELFTYGELTEFFDGLNSDDIKTIQDKIRKEIKKEINPSTKFLVPLKELYCDKCKGVLAIDEAVIEYYNTSKIDSVTGEFHLKPTGFRVFHFETCQSTDEELLNEHRSIMNYFLGDGTDALASLVAIAEEYKGEYPSELMELIKRVGIPYYEEARLRPDKIERAAKGLDWPAQDKYSRDNLRRAVITSDEEFKEQDIETEKVIQELKNKGMIRDFDEFL